MTDRRRFVRAVLVLALLVGALGSSMAGPMLVEAQQIPGAPDDSGVGANASDGDDADAGSGGGVEVDPENPRNSTSNQTVQSNQQNGGWLGFQLNPPDPVRDAINGSVGGVLFVSLGVPYPDIGVVDTEPIHPPTNWPYVDLFPLYLFLTGMTVALSGVGVVVSGFNIARRRDLYKSGMGFSKALLAGIGGLSAMFLTTILFAIVHYLSLEIAPAPAEIATSLASVFKFGVFVAFFAGSMIEMGWNIVKWIGMIHGFTWVVLALYPLVSSVTVAAAIYRSTASIVNAGASILYVVTCLLLGRLASAICLWAAWTMDWGLSAPGAAAVFISYGFLMLWLAIPPASLIIALFSRTRVMRNVVSGAAGMFAGSTIASKMSDKKPSLPDKGKKYGKRAAAGAQGKIWDAKERAKAAKSMSKGDLASAAKDRVGALKKQKSGEAPGSSGDPDSIVGPDARVDEPKVTNAERVRNLENQFKDNGVVTPTQRERYKTLKMQTDDDTSKRSKSSRGGASADD